MGSTAPWAQVQNRTGTGKEASPQGLRSLPPPLPAPHRCEQALSCFCLCAPLCRDRLDSQNQPSLLKLLSSSAQGRGKERKAEVEKRALFLYSDGLAISKAGGQKEKLKNVERRPLAYLQSAVEPRRGPEAGDALCTHEVLGRPPLHSLPARGA